MQENLISIIEFLIVNLMSYYVNKLIDGLIKNIKQFYLNIKL